MRVSRPVRLPWGMHLPAAGRGVPTDSWRPGSNGSGMALRGRPSIGGYQQQTRTPITGNSQQATFNAQGTATIRLGPNGLGTTWYPQAATVATSVGANDAATVTIYKGAQAVLTVVVGQSYSGGGDTVGLSSPPLQPGEQLIAIWTGGTSGKFASLVIYGDQTVLS